MKTIIKDGIEIPVDSFGEELVFYNVRFLGATVVENLCNKEMKFGYHRQVGRGYPRVKITRDCKVIVIDPAPIVSKEELEEIKKMERDL